MTVGGNAILTGNLTVNGTTTTVNSNTVNIGDNIIVLNADETGVPSQDAGITIERGTSADKSLLWDETNDRWTVGTDTFVANVFQGSLSGNATTATTLQTGRTITLSGDVSGSATFNGGSNVTITATVADDSHNHTIANIDNLQASLNTLQSNIDGKEAIDAEILRADTDDNLTAGYTSTAVNDGTKSSGTYTPSPVGGNLRRIVNGGAFTLAAPTYAGDYTMIIQVTNTTGAGVITMTGFNRGTGDATTTTSGHDFFFFITKINNYKSINIQALQ